MDVSDKDRERAQTDSLRILGAPIRRLLKVNLKGSKPSSGTVASPSKFLHYVAGCIVILYALSHFGFLAIGDREQRTDNIVFPFLTNGELYLGVAILEITLGVVCFRLAGRETVSIVILSFIGGLLWYRWAFFFNGGSRCNCLGLLGRLLSVSRPQERAITAVTMTILAITTFPWLLAACQRRIRGFYGPFIMLTMLTYPQCSIRAQDTFEVRGFIESANYNPNTGQPHLNTKAHSAFVATCSEHGWLISVTNQEHGATWWTQRAYDGTNTYVLRPSSGNFWYTNPPQLSSIKATISPSATAITLDGDPFGAALVSITYCLSPALFTYR